MLGSWSDCSTIRGVCMTSSITAFAFTILLVVVVWIRYHLSQKPLIQEVETVGKDLEAQLNYKLGREFPHPYDKGQLSVSSSVESYFPFGICRFWLRVYRILLTINLSPDQSRKRETIETVSERFANEFMCRPGNWSYRARVRLNLVHIGSEHQGNEGAGS